MIILAHGALGIWDEVIFIAVAALFTVAVIGLWRLSRRFEPDLDEGWGEVSAKPERETSR